MIEPLSERKLDILLLIAEGLTNLQVGARLYVLLNTVKSHPHNIYGKLEVHNRTQAILQAQELGLLERKEG